MMSNTNPLCQILGTDIHVRKIKVAINRTAKDGKRFFLKVYNIAVILNRTRNRNFQGGSIKSGQ